LSASKIIANVILKDDFVLNTLALAWRLLALALKPTALALLRTALIWRWPCT